LVLRQVEALVDSPSGSSRVKPGEGTGVPRLITASQAANGGACVSAMAWSCWTVSLVVDEACEKLPERVLKSLKLKHHTPLPTLLRHLANVVGMWTAAENDRRASHGARDTAVLRQKQGAILLVLLEIHELLQGEQGRVARRGLRTKCEKALSRLPFLLFDSGEFRLPSDVYVDLDHDLGPRIRAPPSWVRDFYYLLQSVGAPRVPIGQCPTAMITDAPPIGLGALGRKLSEDGFERRHALADVRIDLPASDEGAAATFFAHLLVIGSTAPPLAAMIVGPLARVTVESCSDAPDLRCITLGEEFGFEPAAFSAWLHYLYTGTASQLGQFGVANEQLPYEHLPRSEWRLEVADENRFGCPICGAETHAEHECPATGGITTASEDASGEAVATALGLLRLADAFAMGELQQRCECYLSAPNVINVNNACELLQHAVGTNASQLRSCCAFYIQSMRDMVTATAEWASLSDDIKSSVLP
jgi:hypothetical protein